MGKGHQDTPPALLPCHAVVPLQLTVNPLPDDSVSITDEQVCQVPFTGAATILLQEKDPGPRPAGPARGLRGLLLRVPGRRAGGQHRSRPKDVPYAFDADGATSTWGHGPADRLLHRKQGRSTGPWEFTLL